MSFLQGLGFGADNLRAIAGVFVVTALCWIVSENRRKFPWRMTLGAVALQVGLVLAFFALPGAQGGLAAVTGAMDGLIAATAEGTKFVFGYLGGGAQPYQVADPNLLFVFAFQVMPLILVFSALSALLWHLGILRVLVRGFGFVFEKTMGLGGASALAAATNILLGMVESALVIRGYLDRLTRSEMFLMMTVGLATVAGSTMVAYAAILKPVLPHAAAHVLAASIISAPAGIALARIMIPETDGVDTAHDDVDKDALHYEGAMDALTRGISDGLQIVLNIGATLIVFVALVALVNAMLSIAPNVGGAPLTLERMLGFVLTPLAWMLGISWQDAPTAGRLLGVKSVLTEFVGFIQLGALPLDAISERTRMIMTYAMCGFANVGAVGIMISGLSVMIPHRRREVLELAWKSFYPGFLATCMTAAIVGAMPARLFAM
ncbi:MAG: NupC/NupG family nucleoside CNT transporter [Hyphomonadaceae bacterium]